MGLLVGLSALIMIGGAAWWARRRLLIATVRGRSMEPTLHPGDRLLVHRRTADRLIRGDIVLINPPGVRVPTRAGGWTTPDEGLQVKRVAALPGDALPTSTPARTQRVPADTVVVLSDNPDNGLDSRHWGPYPASEVVGVVVHRLTTRHSDHIPARPA